MFKNQNFIFKYGNINVVNWYFSIFIIVWCHNLILYFRWLLLLNLRTILFSKFSSNLVIFFWHSTICVGYWHPAIKDLTFSSHCVCFKSLSYLTVIGSHKMISLTCTFCILWKLDMVTCVSCPRYQVLEKIDYFYVNIEIVFSPILEI